MSEGNCISYLCKFLDEQKDVWRVVSHQTELLIHLHLSDAYALQIFQYPEKRKQIYCVKYARSSVET